MAQPEIPGTGVGRPVMPFGSDGSKWIALLVDALGRLQIDAVIDNLPSDPTTQTTLAAALTALQSIQNLVGALHDVGLDELDVRVEGFDPVPTSPVNEYEGGAVVSGDWITIVSYTVTTNKTFYLTDIIGRDATGAAGVEFMVEVQVGGAGKFSTRIPAGHTLNVQLRSPIKATSAQEVTIRIYQWSGVGKDFIGSLIGFEV